MADSAKKVMDFFTYSDYLAWPEDKSYEVIEGVAYSMAPRASEIHQDVSGELFYFFKHYLRDKKCKVYHPPFDVILPEKGETLETASNVVQPDLFIVCDKDKRTDRGCLGAPDLIIEILSPSSVKRDTKVKRKLYQRFGVKEYWIADPAYKSIQVFKLNKDGRYDFPEIYAEDDKIKAGIFNDELEIELDVIFGG